MSLFMEVLSEISKNGTEVKVLCFFERGTGPTIRRYLPVRDVEYHWTSEVDPTTQEAIGTLLVIDSGYVDLPDLQETYFARGVPPLVYKRGDPFEVRSNEGK